MPPDGRLPKAPRVGRCATCGRQSAGVFKDGSTRECQDPCPRCGVQPFYLDHVAPYSGNVSRMSVEEAREYIEGVQDTDEMEVLFRLEVLGNPPRGRREVMQYAYNRYWDLAWLEDPGQRAIILPLKEAIDAWQRDLQDPPTRRYYENLIRVDPADDRRDHLDAVDQPPVDPIKDY